MIKFGHLEELIQGRFVITKCCAYKYIILSPKVVLKKLEGLGFLLKYCVPQITLMLNYLFSSIVWIENAGCFFFSL